MNTKMKNFTRKTNRLSSRSLWRQQFLNVKLSLHHDASVRPSVYSTKGGLWCLSTVNVWILTRSRKHTPRGTHSMNTCMSRCVCSAMYSRTAGINMVLEKHPLYWECCPWDFVFKVQGKGGSRDLSAFGHNNISKLTFDVKAWLGFTSSWMCWLGLRSELFVGQWSFSTPRPESFFFTDLALCMGALTF